MNNKGFTLVELLAVIVILALLALLTTTSVTKLVKDAKEDLSNTQITLIKEAAETWSVDNLDKLPDSGECSYLTLYDLKQYGLINDDILDPKTNQNISDDIKIKMTTTTSSYGKLLTNYEVDSKDVTNCKEVYKPICTAVTSTTEGNVPQGNYDFGDKYLCDVGDGVNRYFYILEDGDNTTLINGDTGTTGKGEVTLIYDRNIDVLTAWNTNGDIEEGPITALETLKEETKNWNVKVNLPTAYQLAIASGHNTWSVPKKLSYAIDPSPESRRVTFPLVSWLYNNIDGIVSGYPYWTTTSFLDSEDKALAMVGFSFNSSANFISLNQTVIRPVITVAKIKIK